MLYVSIKFLFDIILSLIGLVISSPLIAIIALIIKLDSKGPVFYKGIRVGKYGKHFRVFKFRTMVINSEKMGASSTPDDDLRLTRVGRVLRRFKLDELPQIINILKGEMSFVGPRPQVPWIVELDRENYKTVLRVRPGIADYAFVMLPSEGEVIRGSKDPDGDYLRILHPEKMRLSIEYVQNRSFWLDLKIFIDTAMLSFFKRSFFFRPISVEDLLRGVLNSKGGDSSPAGYPGYKPT
jgi:lipopolysaccharide/colanic/teichoic acid biosynthesis glycosyltransferase